jgi:hypothetical protein
MPNHASRNVNLTFRCQARCRGASASRRARLQPGYFCGRNLDASHVYRAIERSECNLYQFTVARVADGLDMRIAETMSEVSV